MKKFLMLGLMGVAMVVQCSALEVDVTRINGYYTYPGGEFNVSSVDPSDPQFLAILGHYSAQTIVPGLSGAGFETFCNSGNIEIQGNPENGTILPVNISLGGAWLYSQFALGILADYDYSTSSANGFFANRAQAAYALQNAIWALNGTGGNDLDFNAFGIDYFLNQAYAMFGTNDIAASNGAYGVQELYLTYDGANGAVEAQPMLVLVPDGGSTIILLGMALTGVGIFTRRFLRA